MNGPSILANGNGNGISTPTKGVEVDKVDGSKVDGAITDDKLSFPKSKEELARILQKYSQLLERSKEAKSKHEQLTRYLDTNPNGGSEFNRDRKPVFIDQTLEERIQIERILFQVAESQRVYLEEEESILAEIKNEMKHEGEDINDDLLSKQIVGLQLLSKDLDIPESLQKSYDDKFTLNDIDDASIEDLKAYVYQKPAIDDFMERAKHSGIDIPLSIGSIEPMYAPLGNYYTEQMISSKISNRIKELEALPSNLGAFDIGSENQENLDSLKVKALIELKSLRVLAKQKGLKKSIIINEASNAHSNIPELSKLPLTLQTRRSVYLRPKVTQPNPHLLAIQLEEKKKLEARRKEHALHVEKVSQILERTANLMDIRFGRENRRAVISRNIASFHSTTERDESKKLEKTAKQRLQALKANDEEAYMKLLDQTKDHRITHLLKQTNQFLDSLAQQVKEQQVEQGADIPLENPQDASLIKEDNVDQLREKIDYYQVAHRIKEDIKEQPKILVGGKLKEYQIKGLAWMVSLYNNKLNGILADEMGLGKTIQSISLITYLIENKGEDKFLVIVPLSTITNWTLEFEKWAPSVRVVVYKGSQQQRKSLQNEVRTGNFQVMLTTYEYSIRERPLLSKFHYSHMIIDEGHRMKNANSKLSVTLRSYYKTKNRLILTGTPLQNNLPELWALLNFALPKIFNSVKSFDEWFNTPFANTGSQEKIELTEEESLLVIRRLHKVLRPFLLRRLKKDVEKDLPDKVEKVLKCNLSGLQYILYQQMLSHNALFVGAETGSAKSGIKGLNNKIMQLRKICNHPFVFEEVENVLNSSRLTNDYIWRTSGKFELLDRILPKFKASGHRVLMFFQMTQVMDIMEDFLRWRDMKYLRLDGSTKAEDRQDMLKVFNAPNSDYFCFLLSTRAGGLGLNLQTADTVIIFDTDWNPHQDLQAQDRAHRIGQKNEVRILRLITNDSVEEVILERAHQKLDIDGKVIQAGKFDNKSTAEEQEEFLKKLLEAEASKGDDEESNALDEDELNEVLARSEDEKVLFAKIDTERTIHDKMQARQGVYKTRLIEEAELPSIFTEDISHHFEKDNKELTRMREKKRVKYDDGLTEEQWLMAMDDDEDTVEDAIKRKEERKARRRAREASHDSVDSEEAPRKRSRRSRTPQNNGFKELDESAESEVEEAEEETDELYEAGKQVLDEISALKADDGHEIAEAFMVLPSRKLYADYYQIIKQPVSINQVAKNLKSGKFESFEAIIDDLQTMCNNAKTYNEEGSWVYEDAVTIENLIQSKLSN